MQKLDMVPEYFILITFVQDEKITINLISYPSCHIHTNSKVEKNSVWDSPLKNTHSNIECR